MFRVTSKTRKVRRARRTAGREGNAAVAVFAENLRRKLEDLTASVSLGGVAGNKVGRRLVTVTF